MQTHWQINGQRKLILFFSGWAMDGNPTTHIESHDADVCTCFDYRSLETNDLEKWQLYDEVILVGWSTGVWAAEQVLVDSNSPITRAIAINGTSTTAHDETGIPRAIFQGTYDNLNPQTMQKFQRRMVGSAAAMKEFSAIAPKRDLDEQKEELAAILAFDFHANTTSKLKWNKAIIGKNDAIFPVENQLRYWKSRTEIVEMEMPHYPFFEMKDWMVII
ncbi:DUF452 family protein [Parabacteroides sp. FAFU027]|uniref:DUF452 family protein n=1 Tax=Parabacteroides sp. FAFU027 TaxID=2922715 RepID=UPI001FAF6C4E|nr:pimeloyl-ACP methyl esterase BioG family protein [Parabacteroides sp. FAFU027]